MDEADHKRHRPELPTNGKGDHEVLDAIPVHGVELTNPANPVVFFDVEIGTSVAARIKFELFLDSVPKTAENFRQLCTGETQREGRPVGYKGASIHRVVPGLVVQGGDFIRGDGTGTFSIYGDFFDDEVAGLRIKHDRPGVLSMASTAGMNRAGCQFIVTLDAAPQLDGKHVVFGRAVGGLDVLERIAKVPLAGSKPIATIAIAECGEL